MGEGPVSWTGVGDGDGSVIGRAVSRFGRAGGGIKIWDAVGPRAFDEVNG